MAGTTRQRGGAPRAPERHAPKGAAPSPEGRWIPPVRRRKHGGTLLAALLSSSLLAAAAGALPPHPEDPSPPPAARRLFHSDLELSPFNLEDPSRPEIRNPLWLRYLGWQQRFSASGYPRLMEGSLARGGAGVGQRYLRLPDRGGRALLTSALPVRRHGTPPRDEALSRGARVRLSLSARWDDLGAGRWGIALVPGNEFDAAAGEPAYEGAPIPLVEEQGAGKTWRSITREITLPGDFRYFRLELWLEGEPGPPVGELGIDEVLLELYPGLEIEWREALGRVSPHQEQPITLRGVELAPGPYRIDLEILDREGGRLHRQSAERYVTPELPIHYRPRLPWSRTGLARGLYTLLVRLTAEEGWVMEERRPFILAGAPPFPGGGSRAGWGVEVDPSGDEPAWLEVADPGRILIPLSPPPVPGEPPRLPPWILAWQGGERGAILDPGEGWSPPFAGALDPLTGPILRWYWKGSGADAEGRTFLDELEKRAPFLVTGFLLPPGEDAPVRGERILRAPPGAAGDLGSLAALGEGGGLWSARIDKSSLSPDPALAAAELATLLYLLASRRPETVYLASPQAILFEAAPDSTVLPRPAFLAWEFVTAFLSGALFATEEEWDPGGRLLVFERHGEEFLVALTDGRPHPLRLRVAGEVRGYNGTGAPVEIAVDAEGIATIPVGRDPILVRGIDLPRERTVRSLRVETGEPGAGGGGDGGTTGGGVRVALENHLSGPVRARLVLDLPAGWEGPRSLEERALDPGASTEWPITVVPPASEGIDGPALLTASLALTTASGRVIREEIPVPVPVSSPLLEISLREAGGARCTVAVRNKTASALMMNLYMQVSPDAGAERTWIEEHLPAGAERLYSLALPTTPGAAAERRLWVGVTLPQMRTYLNRVFPLR